MTAPDISYLDPAGVEMALGLARDLQDAADDVLRLTGGNGPMAGGGRMADVTVARRRWAGPHRDTFDQLIENEMRSAGDAAKALDEEADAWAAFWARATNARRQRLYDEAVEDYRRASARYDQTTGPRGPPRPTPPEPPTLVVIPTAENRYRPTG